MATTGDPELAVDRHGDSWRRVRVVAFPHSNQGQPVPEGADRLRVTADVAVVPQYPKLKTPATAT
jgi:hypothetical protein